MSSLIVMRENNLSLRRKKAIVRRNVPFHRGFAVEITILAQLVIYKCRDLHAISKKEGR